MIATLFLKAMLWPMMVVDYE